MAVNKVAFFGNTIMDISDTTADESSVVAAVPISYTDNPAGGQTVTIGA